ncbi:MAG: hypothetical protein JJLCMIEE_01393 [Acidimicrobiales bacterium]|nr:hypothetical protein [Acidimicrobiales bacterium]
MRQAVDDRVILPRPVGELLIACARNHAWDEPVPRLEALLPLVDARTVVDAALVHGLVGCVHLAVAATAPEGSALSIELAAVHRDQMATHLRARHALRAVASTLHQAGVPWVAVKGPVLASHIYERPDLRGYVDLDVVVDRSAFADAVIALEAAGLEHLCRSWEHVLDERAGEIPMHHPVGMVVDLHWDLVNRGTVRRAFRIDTRAMIGRSRTVDLGDGPVPTFDETDTLLHLSVHGALSGGNRLVWTKDIEQVILAESPDWDRLVGRAHEARCALPAAVMLDRAAQVMQIEVPAPVLRSLDPGRGWLTLDRLARNLPPLQRSPGAGSLSRLVSRATRATPSDSYAQLLRSIGRWTAERTGGGRASPPRRDGDPTDARAKSAYLRGVSSGGW